MVGHSYACQEIATVLLSFFVAKYTAPSLPDEEIEEYANLG